MFFSALPESGTYFQNTNTISVTCIFCNVQSFLSHSYDYSKSSIQSLNVLLDIKKFRELFGSFQTLKSLPKGCLDGFSGYGELQILLKTYLPCICDPKKQR